MSFITSPGIIVPPLIAGGVAYGTGSQAKVNSAGTTGQALLSAGAGVPTWGNAAGSVVPPFTAGAVAYGTGTDVKLNAAGTVGQVLTSAGAGVPTWATAAAGGYTLATPVASTSGTSIDFTGIPTGTKQIIVSFVDVSTDGGSPYLIQIGDSGGIEVSGYGGRSAAFNSGGTAQFASSSAGYLNRVNDQGSGTSTFVSGSITVTLQNSTSRTWVATGMLFSTGATVECAFTGGSKSLSATLDRLRITTVNGTDAFDSGSINIAYI